MKWNYALALLWIFTITSAHAIEWEVIGNTSMVPVHRGKFEADLKKSAGELTVQILTTHQIPFVGNEAGINSILNTPTGDKAIVIVSNDTMRVYGWCFEVDGVQPDVMPDKYFIPAQNSKLSWFYAFSLYEKGEWKTYCTPAHTKPRGDSQPD